MCEVSDGLSSGVAGEPGILTVSEPHYFTFSDRFFLLYLELTDLLVLLDLQDFVLALLADPVTVQEAGSIR